ncbi:Aste57867_2757 [Aphanomyces stellatus]|uniref:Aste57867_2757 protein n=1 Tax=Aphanomyces stellatus TaxID=120398 RepID=A0A485KCH9_9STRA|nr:hypothetical protein As57867_002750 [Aphanomyces stellatus]VFT79949.1 Aste57867_2757 [Aphanomyces stellatus]
MSSTVSARATPVLDAATLTAFDLCLTSLQVSTEKHRGDKFVMPPTPLGSPIHARCAKRSRVASTSFDEPILEEDVEVDDVQVDAAGSALVILSTHLENELELLQKREWKRTRKSHEQLGFYAITSAFHRALAERNAAQPVAPAGQSAH